MSFVRLGNRKRTPPRRRSTRGSIRDSLDSNYSNLVDRFNEKNGTFDMSMSSSRRSVLTDNTDIEEPRRKSWWKNLGEHSRDVIEILESQESNHIHNVVEEYADVELLSQEREHASLNFSDSSDSHVSSINIPHKRLFTQKENIPQNKFTTLFDKQDGMTTLQKTFTDLDNTLGVTVQPRKLFKRSIKQRTKSIFPTELLYASKSGEHSRHVMTNDDGESDDTLKPADSDVDLSSQEQNRESLNSDTSHVSSINIPHRRLFTKKQNAPQDKLTKKFDKEEHTRSESDKTLAVNIQPTKLFKSGQKTKSIFPTEMLDESEDDLQNDKGDETLKDVEGANKEVTRTCNDAREVINKSKEDSQQQIEQQEHEESNAPNSDEEYDEMEELRKHVSALGEQSRNLLEDDTERINSTRKHVGDVDMEEMSGPGSESGDHSKEMQEHEQSIPDMLDNYEMEDLRLVSDSDESSQDEDEGNNQDDDDRHNSGDDAEMEEELNSHANKTETAKPPQHSKNIPEVETQANISIPNASTKTNNVDMEVISSHAHLNESVKSPQHPKDLPEVDNRSSLNTSASKTKNVTMEAISKAENEVSKSQDRSRDVLQLTESDTNKDDNAVEEHAVTQNIHKSGKEMDKPQEKLKEIETNARDEHLKTIEKQPINKATNKSPKTPLQQLPQYEDSMKDIEDPDIIDQLITPVLNRDSLELTDTSQVHSINIPHRRLFTQNNKVPQNRNLFDKQSIASPQNAPTEPDLEVNVPPTNLSNNDRKRTRPIFPSDLLNISNLNKTKDATVEATNKPRTLFGNRGPARNMFTDFIASESEAEISEIHAESESTRNSMGTEIQPESESTRNSIEIDTHPASESTRNSMGVDMHAEPKSIRNNMGIVTQPESESTRNSMGTEIQPESESTRNSIEIDTHPASESTRNSMGVDVHPEPKSIRNNMGVVTQPESESTRNSMDMEKQPNRSNMGTEMQPELESTRNSMGSVNSSGARSEWDSHRTLRKTMRKTFGKDFTPRKSLRTLIMEKTARRQTAITNPINNETDIEPPAANSTEIHQYTNVVHSPQVEAPRRVQTTLEQYLLKLEQNNLQIKQRVQEKVKGYMNAPVRKKNNEEMYMRKPTISRTDNKKPTKQRPRKNFDLLGPLPEEFLQDVNYKPPKRYKPPNASWVTKKLYTFLEKKLEPKYFYKSRVRAEKIVEALFDFNKMIKKFDVAPKEDIEKLKVELAKMNVVQTHFEFYNFIREFMPTEFRVKVIPDISNQLPLPPGGVFVDITSRHRLG